MNIPDPEKLTRKIILGSKVDVRFPSAGDSHLSVQLGSGADTASYKTGKDISFAEDKVVGS